MQASSDVSLGTTDAGTGGPASRWRASGDRAAVVVFAVAVVAAGLAILFRLGDHFWFFRDDWQFLSERQLSVHDIARPHAGHLTGGLVIYFRVLYRLFGIDSYFPYQLGVVAMHLGVVVLLRVIMRRAGVGPWTATLVAGSLALFGSGREDILWAFQFGFTGSLTFGLLQLVLADHDGRLGWRDGLALAAGGCGVFIGSPALICLGVTAGVVLVRRGIVPTLVQTVPIGILYLTWSAVEDPVQAPLGDPPLHVLQDWVGYGITSTFRALGIHAVVGAAIALVLVVGVAMVFVRPLVDARPSHFATGRLGDRTDLVGRGWRLVQDLRGRLAPVAAPVGMGIGALVFMVVSGRARWFQGTQGAGASRYLYPYAVFVLPAYAVATQALFERWRVAGLVALGLLLSGVPVNASRFDDRPWAAAYFDRQEALVRGSLTLPYSWQVPGDVKPMPDLYLGSRLDMAFLRSAAASDRLHPSTDIPPLLRNELALRLSIGQRPAAALPEACNWIDRPTTLRVEKGERFVLSGTISVRMVRDGRPTPFGTPFKPEEGSELTVERGPLYLRIESGDPAKPLHLCQVP